MSLFRLNPVILLAGLAAGAASALQPGTYTAEVNGHNAPLTVKVTVDANRITSIDTSKNLETIGVGKVALDKVGRKILKYQSINVDSVTGASFSSAALKEGVKQCLIKAGADMKDGLRINRVHHGRQCVEKPDLGAGGVAFYDGTEEKPADIEAEVFYNAVTKGTPLTVEPEQALVVTQLLEAIYESAKTGKTIYFD